MALVIRCLFKLFFPCTDILKNTPKTNPDHSALEQALAALREVMLHINEDKRKTEGQVTLFNIFNDIDNCPVSKYFVNLNKNKFYVIILYNKNFSRILYHRIEVL